MRSAVLGLNGVAVAPLLIADTMLERALGLLGRDGVDGAMLLRPCRSVHTFRMRFAIDVAFCDSDLTVLRTVTLARNRPGASKWRAKAVIEAEAGAFHRWGLVVGQRPSIDPIEEGTVERGTGA